MTVSVDKHPTSAAVERPTHRGERVVDVVVWTPSHDHLPVVVHPACASVVVVGLTVSVDKHLARAAVDRPTHPGERVVDVVVWTPSHVDDRLPVVVHPACASVDVEEEVESRASRRSRGSRGSRGKRGSRRQLDTATEGRVT